MSDVAISVDKAEADRILQREWTRITTSDETDHLDDDDIGDEIREILNASQLTYKYILVTNILAKAVNSDVHYRAMQAKADLDGAYNARSLGHQVVVDWEKENGERLGGSNEPFLNKPARDPEFSLENAARSREAQERLYDVLEGLQEKTSREELDPTKVLRHTLDVVSRLEPQTVDFASPSSAPYRELEPLVKDYLETSGGGERLAAVTAGVMQAYYRHASSDNWRVEAEHANVPDEFSNAAGDVEVFRDDELVRAAEVKDKPSERSDIQHAVTKARESELGEYLYVLGAGFRDEAEKQGAIGEIEDAPIELVPVSPDELVAQLKFVGDTGRVRFVEAVGEFLNEMRADETNKRDWTQVAEEME